MSGGEPPGADSSTPRRGLWRGRRVSGYHVGAQGYAHLQRQDPSAAAGGPGRSPRPPGRLRRLGRHRAGPGHDGGSAVPAAGGARAARSTSPTASPSPATPRRWATARSSSISSTPTASRCGPTTTIRRRRPRPGSPGRPSNTAGRCSRPSIPTWARPRSSAGCTTPRRATGCKLSGTEAGGRAYEVAQLELLPQTENIFLIFKDGWHAVETAGDNSMVEWQWTKKEATITFRNPRRDAVLYFQADNPGKAATAARQVEIRLGDQVLQTVAAQRRRRCPCTRSRSAPRPWAAARWSSCGWSSTRPSCRRWSRARTGNDPRELGARVFHAFVQPVGS